MNLIEMKLNLKSENQMYVAACAHSVYVLVYRWYCSCVFWVCVCARSSHRFLVFARQIYIIMKSWKYHCYFSFYFHFIIDSRKSVRGEVFACDSRALCSPAVVVCCVQKLCRTSRNKYM